MSEEKTGFLTQLTGVLYKPRQIFKSMDEGDLIKGLAITLVMVILAAYSSMLYLSKIPLSVVSPQLRGIDTSQFEGSMGLFAGIGSGITIIFGWTAATLLIHGLGRLSGGNGSMKRLFAMHGFASVPSLFNQLIRVIDAYLMDGESLAGYFIAYRDIESKVLKALMGTNLFNFWGLVTIVLLVLAVEENYQIGRGRAVMIVLLPSLIYFSFNYFTG